MSVEVRSRYKFPNATDEHDGWLSPSQVNEYRDCARCYFHNRVQHIPRMGSIHFAIGGALHKTSELIGLQVIAKKEVTKGDRSAWVEAGVQEFDERVTAPVDEETGEPIEIQIEGGKYDDLDKARQDTEKFARLLVEALPPLFVERGLIEVELDIADFPEEMLAAAFPFPVKGRLDHVYGSEEGATGSTDLKSSSKMAGPDENGVLQFCWYGLPAHMGGSEWWTGADIIAKKVVPEFGTYLPNGTGFISDAQYAAARELILDTADAISDGFHAYQEEDWRTMRRCFPIGKGWNGKHNYDHNLPEYQRAARGFE